MNEDTIRLGDIATARSGDKGSNANVGVIARHGDASVVPALLIMICNLVLPLGDTRPYCRIHRAVGGLVSALAARPQ